MLGPLLQNSWLEPPWTNKPTSFAWPRFKIPCLRLWWLWSSNWDLWQPYLQELENHLLNLGCLTGVWWPFVRCPRLGLPVRVFLCHQHRIPVLSWPPSFRCNSVQGWCAEVVDWRTVHDSVESTSWEDFYAPMMKQFQSLEPIKKETAWPAWPKLTQWRHRPRFSEQSPGWFLDLLKTKSMSDTFRDSRYKYKAKSQSEIPERSRKQCLS